MTAGDVTAPSESLSARRAWIEIAVVCNLDRAHGVALRKESVDRNLVVALLAVGRAWSLSARRAWIEIFVMRYRPTPSPGRSPQGERG